MDASRQGARTGVTRRTPPDRWPRIGWSRSACVALVGAGSLVVRRSRLGTPTAALGAPRFVDETAAVRPRPHLRRRLRVLHGRRRGRVRLRRRPAPGRLRWRAAPTPRPCSATRARPAARSGSSGWTRREVDAGRGDRRLPARRRRRRRDGPRRPAARASALLRGHGRLPVRARRGEALGLDPQRRLDHGVQRHLGGRRHAADARVRATTSSWTTRANVDRLRRQRARPAGRGRDPATRAPVPLVAGLLHAVDAVQRLGRVRAARPAGHATTASTTATARSSCGGSRPGEAPRQYTAADGWVSMRIWGMGIASQDLTGDGLPEVYLTSQGDNKLQTLLAGPDQPTYRDIALRRGVTAAQPYDGRRGPAVDRLAPGVRGRQQRRVRRPVRVQGQRRRDARLRDPRPEQPAARASRTGRSCEGAEAAGVVTFDRGRGAALVDLNLDGLLDLVAGQPRRTGPGLAQRRRRDGARRRRAMGTLARAPARAAGRQPRRDRRGRRGRRPATRSSTPRARGRWRPRRRPAGLDARRPRPRDDGARPGDVAGRRGRAVAGRRRPTGSSTSSAATAPGRAVDAARRPRGSRG